ncbi:MULTISPECIES: collagen binding domain-containing protein [unclassified Streptococcus]|uniref:MSCRAMM family protein n=1 Tax=unclassified Streptococcus TaxID=2608887 RepID=UPI00359D1C6E
MKKGLGCSQMICLMALSLFLVLLGIRAQASTSNRLFLQLKDYEQIVQDLGEDVSGQTLTAWRLDPQYNADDQEILTKLHGFSEAELDQQFSRGTYPMVFLADRIEVQDMPDGHYYIRQVVATEQVTYRSEIAVRLDSALPAPVLLPKRLPDQEPTRLRLLKTDEAGNPLANVGFRLYALDSDHQEQPVSLVDGYRYEKDAVADKILYTDEKGYITISHLPLGRYRFVEVEPLPGYRLGQGQVEATLVDEKLVTVTLINEKIKQGLARFIKIDGKTKQALSGASFRLLERVGDQYKPVLKNGKEIILTSDEKGFFTVDDLAYGEYYLREVQPPSGYSQLGASVPFQVTTGDTTQQITAIENSKRPRIEVPNTGDMLLYALMLIAIVCFGSGWYLTKQPTLTH